MSYLIKKKTTSEFYNKITWIPSTSDTHEDLPCWVRWKEPEFSETLHKSLGNVLTFPVDTSSSVILVFLNPYTVPMLTHLFHIVSHHNNFTHSSLSLSSTSNLHSSCQISFIHLKLPLSHSRHLFWVFLLSITDFRWWCEAH